MGMHFMDGPKLSTVTILLGLAFAALHVRGVLNPSAFGKAARRFPRNTPLGFPLILAATGWFLYYVQQENVADFTSFKPLLYGVFTLVGVGSCFFLQDFLPVRGVAVLMLLGAKLIVDSARWVDSDWRLVPVTWAYIWVFMGMWLTISPWRLRDIINWVTATDGRTRIISGLRVAFGLFVAVLGFAVFRPAEKSIYAAIGQPGTEIASVHPSHP